MTRLRDGSRTDREVLVAFYHATRGDGWDNNDGWLTDAPIDEWYGVRTNPAGFVVALELGDNQLTNTIPKEIGQLEFLERLDLAGNELTGTIPTELSQTKNLSVLDLGRNSIGGTIPTDLGKLTTLQVLGLGRNQLEGRIPTELGQLQTLQRLSLGGNQFTGRIPAEFGSLKELQVLGLGDNRLTGSIPTELGELISLRWLDLGLNQLTGRIPIELSRLSNLRRLDLQHNRLEGRIPDKALSIIEEHRERDEAHKVKAHVHEYVLVPIELYHVDVSHLYQQELERALRDYSVTGHCEHIDDGLLGELGVRITHCFRRNEEHDDYEPSYILFLESSDDVLNRGGSSRTIGNGVGSGVCLLYHRETEVELRGTIDLLDTVRAQLVSRPLKWRNDALTLAVKLQHWFTVGRSELASAVVGCRALTVFRRLLMRDRERWQGAELVVRDEPSAYAFAFIDIRGNDELDTLERTRTIATCVEAVEVLDSVSGGRIGDNPLDHHMTQMMQQPRSPFSGVGNQLPRPEEIAPGSFDEHWSGSVLPSLVRGLDRDLAVAQAGERTTAVQGGEGNLAVGGEDAPWHAIRDTDEQSWLCAKPDTAVMASTSRTHRQQLVALEVTLRWVWNKFERSAHNLPAIAADTRRKDITGDTLLRELAEQYLRVTSWRIGLSSWPRTVMDDLRRASRLDDNIQAFFEASEEYVRYEGLVREKETRDRDRDFQRVVTIAALALAAVVLGEITISIAGQNTRAHQSVAVLVSFGALLVSPWLVASTYDRWSPRWRRWGLFGGLAFLAPMAIALPWQANFWLYGDFWWPWPGLPLLGITVGWVVGCGLCWRTVLADHADTVVGVRRVFIESVSLACAASLACVRKLAARAKGGPRSAPRGRGK